MSQTSFRSPLSLEIHQKNILLVLLHNLNDTCLNCDFFKSIFSPFGQVKKILIFEKNIPTKAFIEMFEEKEALAARDAMNNTFLSNDSGKINVYLSDLFELKLPQKNHKFAKDYSSTGSESYSPPIKEEKISPVMPSTQAKSLFSIPEVAEFGYKTSQNQLSFNEELALQERPPPGLEKSFKAFQMQKGIFLEKVSSSLAEGKQTKSAKFEIKTPSTNETTMFTPPLMEALSANLTQITAKTPSMMWEENSRVLYVKGLGSKLISVKHVYNLFSNFGDIKRIILLRAKEVALVEFETLEYAKLAKESLNNLCFFNEYLKISFSNYKEIIPKNISKNTSKEDLMICEKGLSRFKNEKNLNINPPSQILHLSNLEKNSCKEEAIFLFFKDVCEVETMKFIFQDEFKNMCLVKFKKMEDALQAIAVKHNTLLDGRKVKISFTKSKL